MIAADLHTWVPELVNRLRAVGGDTQTVEVKSAVGKLPKTVPETISAFEVVSIVHRRDAYRTVG